MMGRLDDYEVVGYMLGSSRVYWDWLNGPNPVRRVNLSAGGRGDVGVRLSPGLYDHATHRLSQRTANSLPRLMLLWVGAVLVVVVSAIVAVCVAWSEGRQLGDQTDQRFDR
jgi:hypothetical protein